MFVIFFFFFSSRRRHTRFDCDWSSDVCSSDLGAFDGLAAQGDEFAQLAGGACGFHLEVADLLDLAGHAREEGDRKSTRLNSSHSQISYAVFCLKKKKM